MINKYTNCLQINFYCKYYKMIEIHIWYICIWTYDLLFNFHIITLTAALSVVAVPVSLKIGLNV